MLYFESETVVKFYNLKARLFVKSVYARTKNDFLICEPIHML